MKIRWKTLFALLLGLALLNVSLFAAARTIVLGGFEALEQEKLHRDMQRAANAVQEELAALARGGWGYAVWDDSWYFVANGNPEYIQKHLNTLLFANLKLDFLLFLHKSGRVVHAQGYRWKDGTEAPVPAGAVETILSRPSLWRFDAPGQEVFGVISLPEGPMLFTAQAIVMSDGKGPVGGALVMGRFLDHPVIDALGERSRLQLALRSYPPPAAELESSREYMRGIVPLPEVSGEPSYALEVSIPRSIMEQGNRTIYYFLRWNVAWSFAGGTALYFFFDRRARQRERRREKEAAAEAALRASEENYRQLSHEFQTLLDGIPDSLTLLDRNLKVVWANRSTLEMWGEGIRPDAVFCGGAWKSVGEACEECPAVRAFASGEPEEGLDHTPDGRVWGVKIFPLYDGNGEVNNVIRLASDITEKLRLREEAARASYLASLGELSAGVAHEINNPDAVILVNAPIVQEAFASALPILDAHSVEHGDFLLGRLPYSRMRGEMPSLCTEIVEAAERIRRIVDDLKDFVRQGASEGREEFDLNEAIETAVRMTSPTLSRETDSFRWARGIGPLIVCGVRHRIEQVLMNLLVNASQALTDRKQEISVAAAPDPSGRRVLVRVRDEGAGIAPEHLSRITEPFFTTRRQRGGTGLGLSVSSRIVADHGGTLTFRSVPGQGTTAFLELPLSAAQGIHDEKHLS